MTLDVQDLHVAVEGKEILKGISLQAPLGAVTVLMGPNGSGKSTLASTLLGHPSFHVTQGTLLFNNKDMTALSTSERAKLGIFLSFQYPLELSGVTVSHFLRTAYRALHGTVPSVTEFAALLKQGCQRLAISEEFLKRSLNEGFSGGEKKRMEALQLLILKPKFAILDETDSGLDVDALKLVSTVVSAMVKEGMGVLLITHYKRFFDYLKPENVYLLTDGSIVRHGGSELVDRLEKEGYAWLKEK